MKPTGLLLSRLFVERFGPELARAEAEAGGNIERIVVDGRTGAEVPSPEVLARVDAAFFSNDIRYDRQHFIAMLQASPNLRWVHLFSVGVAPDAYPELRQRGVVLTNSPGANAPPIAVSVLGAVLYFARPFRHWVEAQSRHAWDPIHYDNAPPDLADQTMLIVGTGEIGMRIARLVRGLDMHVVGVRRSPPVAGEPFDEVHPPARLYDLLPRADWVALACPLTEETRGMINASAFAAMKPGARLINVARGAIVDEAALIEAARSGHLGGAYLDVAPQEPLPSESPLWDLPNVLISPHNAAVSASYPRRSAEKFLANLVRWGRGEPLQGIC